MSVETGYHNDAGMAVPFSGFAASTQKELTGFALGGVRRYGLRKALLSALAQEGVGLEIHSLISEHGNNAFLPGGALSIVPLEVVLDLARDSLERIYTCCGINDVLEGIDSLRDQFDSPPSIITEPQTASRGIAGFPLPTNAEFQGVTAMANTLGNRIERGLAGPNEMRLWLILELALNGVPIGNIASNHSYYSEESFVVGPSGEVFFLAVMPQADLGLGVIPIYLQVNAKRLKSVCTALTKNGRRDLFFKLDLSLSTLGESLLRSAGKESNWDTFVGHRHTGPAAARVSTFMSLLRLGGMVTTGLMGRLLIPPNFYNIGDLLSRDCQQYQSPVTLFGAPIETPYAPSEIELSMRLRVPDIVQLVQSGSLVRGGRPRHLPTALQGRNCACWAIADWVQLFRDADSMISRNKIAMVLETVFSIGRAEAALRARFIHRGMRLAGYLRAGRPLRFVPPDKTPEFVQLVCRKLLHQGGEVAVRDAGMVRAGWATGARIGEAARAQREDYSRIGEWEEFHLRGTKTVRARRDLPLSLARLGPGGGDAVRDFLESLFISNANPAFASKAESVKRISERIGKSLNAAFREFRGNTDVYHSQTEGAYSFHDLRHAAFVRMLQGAIDGHLSRGNFMIVVMKIAQGMGQNIHTALCSYLGSAVLALRWPGR